MISETMLPDAMAPTCPGTVGMPWKNGEDLQAPPFPRSTVASAACFYRAVNTQWGNLLADGDDHERLFGDLYLELKKMARGKVAAERSGATLNTTALVHEAWMRLQKSSPEQWRDRSQFFAAASQAMRRILVEAARRRLAAKRGAGAAHVPFDEIEVVSDSDAERLVEVHEVLDRLEETDPVKASIVRYRFFCGFENEEIASILGVNEKTVRRQWEMAKVWLFRKINQGE